jgi:hypothetical protein
MTAVPDTHLGLTALKPSMSCQLSANGDGRDQKSSARQIVVIQLDSNGDIVLGVFDEVETAMFSVVSPSEAVAGTETAPEIGSTTERINI